MKDKISLWSLNEAAVKDMWELLDLNFMLCLITAIIPSFMLVSYVILYGPLPSYWLYVITIGSIISMTLLGKASLDLVNHRQQNLFSHPSSLIQACLIHITMFVVWYFWFSDFNPLVRVSLSIIKGGALLVVVLVVIAMRLQFTSLYILEQRCSILQAVRLSWLFTRRNLKFADQFFLCQVALIIIWMMFMNYMLALDWNFDFAMLLVSFTLMLATPMRVRMFKELE